MLAMQSIKNDNCDYRTTNGLLKVK